MKHIFCFDGTCNGNDDEFPTNIRTIRDMVTGPEDQAVYYYEGPGNDEDDLIDHWLGAGLGYGMFRTASAAYGRLKLVYQPGDIVVVFGFSRGAAIARMFCHKVCQSKIPVQFLGCFDTVVAFLPFTRFQQDPLFGDLHVSPLVLNARHIVALDENRQAFAPRLMNDRDNVFEIWARGNHADIGGGYEENGLSNRSLQWMLEEARSVTSIDFGWDRPHIYNHEPHEEDLPLLREKRVPIVLVNDKPSDLQPVFLG